MGAAAAKQGDRITATDIHIILVPSPPGSPVPTPFPHPFNGIINQGLSANVKIMGRAAATVGSTATNTPAHMPNGPGPFQMPPSNQGQILRGSATVMINGKAAARHGDNAQSCQDPTPNLNAKVVADSTVLIG